MISNSWWPDVWSMWLFKVCNFLCQFDFHCTGYEFLPPQFGEGEGEAGVVVGPVVVALVVVVVVALVVVAVVVGSDVVALVADDADHLEGEEDEVVGGGGEEEDSYGEAGEGDSSQEDIGTRTFCHRAEDQATVLEEMC